MITIDGLGDFRYVQLYDHCNDFQHLWIIASFHLLFNFSTSNILRVDILHESVFIIVFQ